MPPRKKVVPTIATEPVEMNALALRIWNGQSPDLPLIERVTRIKNALTDKGFPLDGLKLPAEGFEKYL